MGELTLLTGTVEKQDGRAALAWELDGLQPDPVSEWQRLQKFLDFGEPDRRAMLATVEPLFKRGHELVVGNYDYLLKHPETAAILGWDQGADPQHLAERRRFFTIWLARTLGIDLSDEFARYLFRAGQIACCTWSTPHPSAGNLCHRGCQPGERHVFSLLAGRNAGRSGCPSSPGRME